MCKIEFLSRYVLAACQLVLVFLCLGGTEDALIVCLRSVTMWWWRSWPNVIFGRLPRKSRPRVCVNNLSDDMTEHCHMIYRAATCHETGWQLFWISYMRKTVMLGGKQQELRNGYAEQNVPQTNTNWAIWESKWQRSDSCRVVTVAVEMLPEFYRVSHSWR